ncbi:MAG: hypothetical protein JW767_02970 [Thermoleophilia bacterium]|nr:hypothetical protein [Thermoleophilia bacterium]
MPRIRRESFRHVPAIMTAVIVVLLAGSAQFFAACGDDPGDEFLGEWTSEVMGDAVVTVTREGDEFTIELPNKTYEGQMEDDAVFAPFDDPTIVLEMKGDDLIMRFYQEGNALLLKRVE